MKTAKLSLLLNLLSLLAFSQEQIREINNDVLSQDWEFKMISAGDNRPNFEPTEDSIHFVPILLGEGYSLAQIKTHFGWDGHGLEDRINQLLMAEFIVPDDREKYVPNVMIIPIEKGEKIREQILPIAKQISDSIASKIDSLVYKTKQIKCLEKFSFKDISLLVLSNVLLDNGQIRNVEQEYLKAERPSRHGKNYYASYLGKPVDSQLESFGIYGNKVESQGKFVVGRYGNQRQLPEVIATKERLIAQYQDSLQRKNITYPIITNQCLDDITELANYFKPSLLTILNDNDKSLRAMYANSRYAEEVTYAEYFIWLYHILYSETTENLIEQKLIKIPEEKVSFYIVQL